MDIAKDLKRTIRLDDNLKFFSQVLNSFLPLRGHPNIPPPSVSDGCGGIHKAMVKVYEKVVEYAGMSRLPTKKRLEESFKQRERERTLGTRLQVVY